MEVKYIIDTEGDVVRFKQSPTGVHTGTMIKKVGDRVACLKGCRLELGFDGQSREFQTGRTYATGICISVSPFIIQSKDGLGIWRRKNPDHYFAIEICGRRLRRRFYGYNIEATDDLKMMEAIKYFENIRVQLRKKLIQEGKL